VISGIAWVGELIEIAGGTNEEAYRPEPRVGVPLASDDPEALRIAARLVRDAGFDPVSVGGLTRAKEFKEFDVGTPVYASDMSGPEVRWALGLPGPGRGDRRRRFFARS